MKYGVLRLPGDTPARRAALPAAPHAALRVRRARAEQPGRARGRGRALPAGGVRGASIGDAWAGSGAVGGRLVGAGGAAGPGRAGKEERRCRPSTGTAAAGSR